MKKGILLVSCPDSPGLLASITNFIYKNNGNIISLNEYVEPYDKVFFLRLEWKLDNFNYSIEELNQHVFKKIASKFSMNYRFYEYPNKEKNNIAVFVSKEDHVLLELLWHNKQGEFNGNIKLVISNHDIHRELVEGFGIDFYYIPKTKETRLEKEKEEIKILKESNIEVITLAKYMQILSEFFVNEYRDRIINIHHSFLPAFEGSRPYHRAYERGVKLIGATVHYVNEELDRGPIIDQKVVRVSHKDSIESFIKKGRDLEKILLVKGLKLHLEHRIIVYKNRTIIFE